MGVLRLPFLFIHTFEFLQNLSIYILNNQNSNTIMGQANTKNTTRYFNQLNVGDEVYKVHYDYPSRTAKVVTMKVNDVYEQYHRTFIECVSDESDDETKLIEAWINIAYHCDATELNMANFMHVDRYEGYYTDREDADMDARYCKSLMAKRLNDECEKIHAELKRILAELEDGQL